MVIENRTFDLVVLGSGLSGSRLVIEIVEALLADDRERAGAPLSVLVVDRHGAFGGGIPYGCATTRPGFLLIESVAESTPLSFYAWLREHQSILFEEVRQDASLLAWARVNEARLAAERFDELFVPRRVFGAFVAEELRDKIRLATARGLAEVTLEVGDAIDIEPGEPLRVALADGRAVAARNVVLAIGCIPRKNAFDLTMEDGYLHDLYADAFDGLWATVRARAAAKGEPVDVVIVGSAASASEVIYDVAHTPDLLAKVATLHVVSTSGYLSGGAAGTLPDPAAGPSLAPGRPSAREYVEAAARLVLAGKLVATRGKVDGIRRLPSSRLEVAIADEGEPRSRIADVVVGCAGVGRLGATDSRLLQNLAAPGRPFTTNECRRGFVLRPGSYEVNGVEGCFVIGPLLNQDPLESQVESIHAVYRVAGALAKELHPRLARSRERAGG